ncbi:hypothetical protein [Curtobacterium sp. DN_7.5]|uniref:hypothetical protein n=1 Tax=Curtobacterium sp. DN_7.5 TaxID=3049047 RepID=UPI001F56C39A|nr:hypothetical protein [Curtobacterium sp. DN_7.5]
MPASHDFFVASDPGTARIRTADALVRLGYAVDGAEQGGLRATRGSLALTLLLRAWACGRSFHTRLDVQVMVTRDGRSVVRLLQSSGPMMVTGGLVGLARSNRAFTEAANAIHSVFAQAGELMASVPS